MKTYLKLSPKLLKSSKDRSHFLSFLLFIFTGLSLFVGIRTFSIQDIFSGNSVAWETLLLSRVPRTLSILFSGVGVSISGLMMQQLVQNRFVSPATAVTQDAARLGILISLTVFSNTARWHHSISALVFALAGTLLFVAILRRIRFKTLYLVPLLGMMLGGVINAITTFFAMKFDALQVLNTYMSGSFTLSVNGSYELLFVLIPLVVIAFHFSMQFRILSLGEHVATNVGISYRKVFIISVTLIASITAITVSTIGSIPYLGLIVPNIASKLTQHSPQKRLAMTAKLGALFLLMSDILARTLIMPYEVPLPLVMGLCGGLIFLVLLKGDAHA